MNGEPITYLLWIALAIALIIAAVTDIKSRTISNRLNLIIALGAPLMWMATGMNIWPDIVQQIGIAAIIFTIFTILFAIGAMGGGDVKLLGALALWLPWLAMLELLFVMSIAGGLLTALMMIGKRIQKTDGPIKVPYGVAISVAGVWTIWAAIGGSSTTLLQTIY